MHAKKKKKNACKKVLLSSQVLNTSVDNVQLTQIPENNWK